MKKNAFTLIELLAVIVILAIVVLIATPIILGIIRDTKEQANKRSIEMYADSIKNALVNYQLKENKKTISFEDIEQYIEYNGNVVCDIIQIYEDGNIYLNGCIINNDNSRGYIYGEQHLTKENVRPVTESKTGKIPEIDENGNIVPGSEFKIKVSNNIKDENGKIVEYTFFVLSNSEDGKYVNLIAEQNITKDGIFTEVQNSSDQWYDGAMENRYGPLTAYEYLSKATDIWTNIPIIENFYYEDEGNKENSNSGYKNIKTRLEEKLGVYITTITPNSSDYGKPKTFENMRVRLPYLSEMIENTSCKVNSTYSCPYWITNHCDGDNSGYWLLSSSSGHHVVYNISSQNKAITITYPSLGIYGIRPVITVLKSDLLRVMQ